MPSDQVSFQCRCFRAVVPEAKSNCIVAAVASSLAPAFSCLLQISLVLISKY